MAKILVTGASGFIGGTISLDIKTYGHEVVGVDLIKKDYLMPYFDKFVQGDIFNNYDLIKDVDFVIHCAGSIQVGESVKDPAGYYFNNVVKTIFLLNKIVSEHNIPFFFSSSASVYKSKNEALTENDPIMPISPYAFSKYSIERVCEDYRVAYGLKYCIFRYFNACGSLGSVHGQSPGASHILPKLFEEDSFQLNGSDFNTLDGTCIRDYVHVRDISEAHMLAMERGAEGIYNLGTGTGFSNKQIINYVFENIGEKPIVVGERRPGDSDILVADASLANNLLEWKPVHDLRSTVSDLVKWYDSDNYKSLKRG